MPNPIDEKTFKEKIGSRLKEVRQKLDLPQKELAFKFSTTQSNIANIERGSIYPNTNMLLTLLIEYQVNIAWLLTGKGKMFVIDMNSFETDSPLDNRYTEMLDHMISHPDVEELIFAKFKELKLILGDRNIKDVT